MSSYQNSPPVSSRRRADEAIERVHALLVERRRSVDPVENLEAFEREVRAVVADVEREIVAEELGRFDVDVPEVLIDGTQHRRVGRWEQSYVGAAGEIRVARTLYVPRGEEGKGVSPLEVRAGIIEGCWTPLAAKQATWAVSHLTPQESEDFFRQLGGMTPSKSSLDRLPKRLGARWEDEREGFEAALRRGRDERVDPSAAILAVSLDGVLVPMKDGAKQQRRDKTREAGKRVGGPAGFREAACTTVSLHDAEGERLRTIRTGRMPEKNKVTAADQLRAEVHAVLSRRPDMRLAKIADGARTNWDILREGFPKGEEIVDFYHAANHLKDALDVAYGEGSERSAAQFEALRHRLRHEDRGVEKVIRSLLHLRDRFPRRKKLRKELAFFRRNRRRMNYVGFAARGLPIGSGVVEAACKTLVTARMKRSGMRWRRDGGQAILTFRSLQQSDRWDRGWSMLAKTYVHAVELPDNVIQLRRVA
jgi:hypothetical protein